MILVTGATGKTGSELVRMLSSRGCEFRVLARTPEKARALFGDGVEVVAGDLGRPDTLDGAMRGVDRLFLLSSPDPGAPALQESALAAAKRSDVRYVVKMSAVDASPDSPSRFLRLHGEMDRALAKSGLTCTVLHPHSFMQNTLGFAPTISTQGVFYTPPAAAIPLVDVRDIAAVACAVLVENGHEDKTYTITGPERLTYAQIAEKIGAAIGRPVRHVEVPPEAARDGMLGAGVPEWIVGGLLELYAYHLDGRGTEVTRVTEQIAGKTPITFDEFARDHAAAFRGTAPGA
jgi:uncharacterized protein YbjT (DUF2867 family)